MFSELIAYLDNLSFAEGCFPDHFKRAQVTPLLNKEGLDKNTPANYRPISNLKSISKIIERLALIRLRQHLVYSASFNPAQSAYRSQATSALGRLSKLQSGTIGLQESRYVSTWSTRQASIRHNQLTGVATRRKQRCSELQTSLIDQLTGGGNDVGCS